MPIDDLRYLVVGGLGCEHLQSLYLLLILRVEEVQLGIVGAHLLFTKLLFSSYGHLVEFLSVLGVLLVLFV